MQFIRNYIFLILLSFVSLAYGSTNVSGTISTNTHWTLSGSPYLVNGDVQLKQGVKLTIDAGVRVLYSSNAQIIVRGEIQAQGEPGKLIEFSGSSVSKPMFYFPGTTQVPSVLSYLSFKGPQAAIQFGDELEVKSATSSKPLTVLCDNSLFQNSSISAKGNLIAGSLLIKSSKFSHTAITGTSANKPIVIEQSVLDSVNINAEAAYKGMTLSSCRLNASVASLGCCGANLNIFRSEISSCQFVDNDNHYYQLSLKDTKVFCSLFDLPNSDYGFIVSNCQISSENLPLVIRCKNLTMNSTTMTGNGSGTAIELYGGVNHIVRSKIMNNNIGINQTGNCITSVDSSFVCDNTIYNLVNKSGDELRSTDVWWGTTNTAEIQRLIYDNNDDETCGLVSMSRILKTNQFNLSVQIAQGGSVSFENKLVIPGQIFKGDFATVFTFAIQPNAGYSIENVKLNGINVSSQLVNGQYSTPALFSDAVLSVTFKKNQYRLSVRNGEGNSFSLLCDYGATPSFDISSADGRKIQSVLFNGVDLSTLVIDGIFTTPPIVSNSTLVVSYQTIATELEMNSSALHVFATNAGIVVTGLDEPTEIQIFLPDGKLVYSQKTFDKLEWQPGRHGMYFIKIKNKTYKLVW